MKQDKSKKNWKKFLIVYLISCVLMGTVGTTIFLMCANQEWIEVAEEYFTNNEEIKEQIGVYERIKCEGRAEKADRIGLPVDFVVETEKGEFNVTLWVKSKEDASHVVVKHAVEKVS